VEQDRLMLWRFAAAPKSLQSLHCEAETPEWLLLIPRSLVGSDLDDVIVQGAKPGQVVRYETADGDIVFIGTSQLDGLSRNLAALPHALAATQTRRK